MSCGCEEEREGERPGATSFPCCPKMRRVGSRGKSCCMNKGVVVGRGESGNAEVLGSGILVPGEGWVKSA